VLKGSFRLRTTSYDVAVGGVLRRRTTSYDVVYVNCMLMPRSLCTIMNINEKKYRLPLARGVDRGGCGGLKPPPKRGMGAHARGDGGPTPGV
jgi:hypothetical protein